MELESPTTSLGKGKRIKRMSLKALEGLSSASNLPKESDIDGNATYFDADSTSEEENYSSSDESSSEHTENSDASQDFELDTSKPKYLTPNKTPGGRQRKSTASSYAIKSEDYFSHNTTKKNKTSNHTLERLNTPRLSQDEVHKLLSAMTLSKSHEKARSVLCTQNKMDFHKWMCQLQEGFNILVYGLGSKREILSQFCEEFLRNVPVIVVNGFFPSLMIKDILDAILIDILESKENPFNLFEAAELIVSEFAELPDVHLYLMVHNIEGETLRSNPKNQAILATLAAAKNIHLIASIDHINAALIWDHKKLSKFNFTWWDVTSFSSYINETSFETSLMVNRTASLALSSLRNVFLSLTSNSKGIYLMIAKYQLRHATAQYYQGMLFKDLYGACREGFLVSSDLALRAQLSEFVDHKMVKFRRSADGAEYLVIPVTNNLLQQFVSEQ